MRRLLLILATTLALLAPAASASASGLDVIRDCTDDEVMSKTYTQKEYRDALRQFAADGDQYGNCRDVIRRAQAAALAGRQEAGARAPEAAAAPAAAPAAARRPAAAPGRSAARRPPSSCRRPPTTSARRSTRARSTEGAVTLDNGTVIPANAGDRPDRERGRRPAGRAHRPPRAAARGTPSRSPAFASDALSTRVALDDRARVGALNVPTPAVHPLLTVGLAAIICAVAFAADGGLNLGRTTPAEMALILGGGVAVAGALLLAPRRERLWGIVPLAMLLALARAHRAVDHLGGEPVGGVGGDQPHARLRARCSPPRSRSPTACRAAGARCSARSRCRPSRSAPTPC